MSTKIFNGYRVKANTLDEAISILQSKKEAFIGFYNAHILEKKVEGCLNSFFHHLLNPDLLDGVDNIALYLKEDQDLKEQVKFEPFEILIHPKNIHGYYLCNITCPSELVRSMLRCCPELSQYSYWNNTDKSNRVSYKDWAQRKKDWAEAVSEFSFELSGLKMTLIVDYMAPNFVNAGEKKVRKAFKSIGVNKIQAIMAKHINSYVHEKIIKENAPAQFSYSYITTMREKIENNGLDERELRVQTDALKYTASIMPSAQSVTYDFLAQKMSTIRAFIIAQNEKSLLNEKVSPPHKSNKTLKV